MRTLIVGVMVFAVICLSPLNTIANQWYEGGNLHRATVTQWQKASYSNKIATASDWVAGSPKGKSVVSRTRDIDSLRPYAIGLVSCIDEATKGENRGSKDVAEIAVYCMILMDYF